MLQHFIREREGREMHGGSQRDREREIGLIRTKKSMVGIEN